MVLKFGVEDIHVFSIPIASKYRLSAVYKDDRSEREIRMKRVAYGLSIAAFLTVAGAFMGNAAGRFDQKLPVDKQIIHVLNRLTFGVRAADVDQVRRLGVDKWIDLQLHPERIPENPILDAKLQPLETLHLATWQILEKYPAVPPGAVFRPPSLNALASLPPQTMMRLTNGSLAERLTTLSALDPETRRGVLASASPQMLDGLPQEIREESEKLRKAQQELLQAELRKRNPPLTDLLNPDQIRIARTGKKEEKLALINSFEAEKRQQIIRALGPQAFAD